MKNTTTATAVSENETTNKVYGTVRDVYQQPMPGATVRADNDGLHSRQPPGEAVTAADVSTVLFGSKFNLKVLIKKLSLIPDHL